MWQAHQRGVTETAYRFYTKGGGVLDGKHIWAFCGLMLGSLVFLFLGERFSYRAPASALNGFR
jgi:hypothetical protein